MIDAAAIAERWPRGDRYLLNHSAGLPPRDAAAALTDGLFSPWTAADDRVWPHWLQGVEAFRVALGAVIGHEAAMICPQPNVTAALAQVLSCRPLLPRRNRLLLAERAFPSLGFLFAAAQRRGFELVMIPREEDTLDPGVWARYLDERVHLALFTHVHSNSGECHDIAPLVRLASDAGALSAVDVAQSIGVRAIRAGEWNADFIVGSCLKWLCGGSGAGFLWVNPARVADCEPADVGWFSHSDPFEFDIHHFDYAADALRFWGGTPSVAPALVAGHAMRALLELGLDRIEAHNRALQETLVAAVPEQFHVSPTDAAQRGGSVVLHFGDRQEAFIAKLSAADVKFDVRREGVRLSPHFYNTLQDMDCVVNCSPV
jgi:selenocysteine lyase/cysteine desulfurase